MLQAAPTNARQQDVSQRSSAGTASVVNLPGSKKASKAVMAPEPAAGITSTTADATAVKPGVANTHNNKVDTASAAAAVAPPGTTAVPAPAAIAIAASRLPQAGLPQASTALLSTADNSAHETASLALTPAQHKANARQRKKQRLQTTFDGGSSSAIGASNMPAMSSTPVEPSRTSPSAEPGTSSLTVGAAPQAAQASHRQNRGDTAAASSQAGVPGSAATATAARSAILQSSGPAVGLSAKSALVSNAAGRLQPNTIAARLAGNPRDPTMAGQLNRLNTIIAAMKTSGVKHKVCFLSSSPLRSC